MMKRKCVAVLLACAMALSGAATAVAAESGEGMADTSLVTEIGVDDGTVEQEVEEQNVIPDVTALDMENEETSIDEKAADTAETSGTTENGLTWNLKDGVMTISGNGVIESFIDDRSKITSVVIEEGVTGIGSFVFAVCENLKEVQIPQSVTEIGEDAFYGCNNLNKVNIPDGVKEIKRGTFQGCRSLREITIPGSVEMIGEFAFGGDGLSKLSLSNGIKEIGMGAFSDCSELTEVSIPESVTKIGIWAFESCGLTKISIPNSVKEIGHSAFTRCPDLTEVSLPNGIETISSGLFRKCGNLKKADIPDSVTKIEYLAFADCTSLPQVVVPSNVKSIGDAAFSECGGIKKVTFSGNAPVITSEGIENIEIVGVEPFQNVRATAEHPQDNQTWTADITRALGSKLIWIAPKTEPLKIVPEATDNTYVIGSGDGVTITCTGALKDFVSVYMDDVEVDRSNYTLAEGSTILAFTTKYLNTLSVGKHKVTLNYTYGSVDTELTVLDKSNAGTSADSSGSGNSNGANTSRSARSPRTGDNTPILPWAIVSLLAAGICVTLVIRKRHFA